MTRISKRVPDKKQLERLFSQLSHLVAKSTSSNAETLLTELLGYEERVMLAKRLAAIILLSRGATVYKTAQVLQLSTSTTSRINQQLQTGDYSHIQSLLGKKNRSARDLIETIDTILHLGGILPHYNSPDLHQKLK